MARAMTYTVATATDPTDRSQDVAKLLLRVLLGLLILAHGIAKVRGGPGFIVDVVTRAGLPGVIGYLVYVGEVLAPIMLMAGVWTRVAAAIIVVNMLVAVLLVHTGQLLLLADSGGWALELQGMYFGVALAIALLGAGRYSAGGNGGRWN
jgi:putative oxidoreductase